MRQASRGKRQERRGNIEDSRAQRVEIIKREEGKEKRDDAEKGEKTYEREER